MRYSLDNGELEIRDSSTWEVVWQGKPAGHLVIEVVPLADTEDCLLLLEWFHDKKRCRNLWRYSYEEGIIWQAELPSLGPDIYVAVEAKDGHLVGQTWSGFTVRLDKRTGKILSAVFVK
jgi:hypothetical protein